MPTERLGQRHAALGFVIGLLGTLGWAARDQAAVRTVAGTTASSPAPRMAAAAGAPSTTHASPLPSPSDANRGGVAAPLAQVAATQMDDATSGGGSYSEDYDAVLASLAAERTLEAADFED